MERCMERWREGSEDPEVWSMEDRRLMEFYRITICKNGMVVPSQREMIRRRERKLERRKNSLSRKELFAELDKLVEEQKQKHKSVIEENEEENSVENTSLNDDDDDRCLEIAIEEAKQKAAEMKEEMKNNKKKRRGRRGKPKEGETKKAVRTRIRRRKWCVNRVRVNT